jgi:hypothetical protein
MPRLDFALILGRHRSTFPAPANAGQILGAQHGRAMCKSCLTADFGQTFAWKALPLLGQRAPEVRLADQRGPGRERAKNVVFGWPVVQMM